MLEVSPLLSFLFWERISDIYQGTRERHLESILQAALRQLIPVRDFPRSAIQITLQVAETPENAYANTKLVQAQLVRDVFGLLSCPS